MLLTVFRNLYVEYHTLLVPLFCVCFDPNANSWPWPRYIQDADFHTIQKRAINELGTELHYRRIDVRDAELMDSVVQGIGDREGRMDGLVAAAGIQQEVPALDMKAQDANTMFEVNVTGALITARTVAKQMIRFGNGGSIVMIASMSGTVANKVSLLPSTQVKGVEKGYSRILSAPASSDYLSIRADSKP